MKVNKINPVEPRKDSPGAIFNRPNLVYRLDLLCDQVQKRTGCQRSAAYHAVYLALVDKERDLAREACRAIENLRNGRWSS